MSTDTRPHAPDADEAMAPLLARCWSHLAHHALRLPEPYPGAILFFSIAADGEDAHVFHVSGHSLQAAWREGATRARHWAWSHGTSGLTLRVDWVQDITPLPPQAWPPQPGSAPPQAIADPGLERLILLSPTHATAVDGSPLPMRVPGWLQLHLRGCLAAEGSTQDPVVLPRSLPRRAAADACDDAPDGNGWHPLHAGLQRLRATASGAMPQNAARAHHALRLYALLQAPAPSTAQPLPQAALKAFLDRPAAPGRAATRLDATLASLVLGRLAEAKTHSFPDALRQQAALALASAAAVQPENPSVSGTTGPQDDAGRATDLLVELALRLHEPAPLPPAALADWMERAARLGALDWPGPGHAIALRVGWAECLRRLCPPGPPGTPAQGRGTCLLPPLWLAAARTGLQRLHQAAAWPEHTLYLPPHQRQAALQAVFATDAPAGAPGSSPPPLSAPLADALIAWRLYHHLQAAATGTSGTQAPPATLATTPAAMDTEGAEHPCSPLLDCPPMAWRSDTLAQVTGGRWQHLDPHGGPLLVRGIDARRQTHLPGAAVVVRTSGFSQGVAPLAVHSLQPAALLADGPVAFRKGVLPTLLVADVPTALVQVALAARQRVRGQVVAVTGCTGKSTGIRMLAHALGLASTARTNALLTQGTALQMINWSDAIDPVLVELALPAIDCEVPLANPDVLLVTHLPPAHTAGPDQPPYPLLIKAMHLMRQGAALVTRQAIAGTPAVQRVARARGLRLLAFGHTPDGLFIQAITDHPGAPEPAPTLPAPAPAPVAPSRQSHRLQAPDGRSVALQLDADGAHMADNALAALATLCALGHHPADAAPRLRGWLPPAGCGQPQRLPGGICLLDHSLAHHPLSIQAALAHLRAAAPAPSQRLIVLCAGYADGPPCEWQTHACLQWLRAPPARRVLLWGDGWRTLATSLKSQPHLNWYEDLGHLAGSLLRTLQQDDTVLLCGGATLSQAVVAEALREAGTRHRCGPFHGAP